MNPKRFYHPELDVLRFGAFCAVFIDHAIPWQPETYLHRGISPFVAWLIGGVVHSGAAGVTLFFLLSSYLITTLLLREHENSGSIDLKFFYIRRALRIWPLYYFFLAVAFWIAPHLGWPPFGNAYKLGFSCFVANWTMIHFTPIYSPGEILWSVSVEEQFYLLWPLALALLGFGRLRKMAIVMLASATVARIVLSGLHASWWGISLNTLVQLDPIAIGALLAWAFRNGAPVMPRAFQTVLLFVGLSLPPIAMLFFGLSGWNIIVTYPLATIGVALVFVGLFTDSPAPWLRGGLLVYLGKISFGLYVFHQLMLGLAARHFHQTPLFGVVLAFLATLVAAMLSYHLLERPFLQLKEKFAHIKSRPA